MHDEVNAFMAAGLLLRSGKDDATGEAASVSALSSAIAALPGELPRHAVALRAQIESKKREALAKKQGLRKKVVEEKKEEDEEGDDGTQGAPP